ncbi:MAG TPA: hypothetical protein VGL77_16515 [Armatimonadota bacterium]
MRRRISIIWLFLALLPSLWFSLVGALPHSHRQGLPLTSSLALSVVQGDEASIDALTEPPVSDDCALCHWCLAGIACLLLVTRYALPPFLTLRLSVRRMFAALSSRLLLPSRAPPAFTLSF